MALEDQLRKALAAELCGMFRGRTGVDAAALLEMDHADFSRLRNGKLERFSLARLLLLILKRRHNVELHIRPVERPIVTRRVPTIVVVRYDEHGRVAGPAHEIDEFPARRS